MTPELAAMLRDREEIEAALKNINGRLHEGYKAVLMVGKTAGNRPARIEVRLVDSEDPNRPIFLSDFAMDEQERLETFLDGLDWGAIYGRRH